jgi:hypothetical protein
MRLDLGADLVLGCLLEAQPEGDVVEHVEMREQRIALEHHVDRPVLGRRATSYRLAIDLDLAGGREIEAGDHAHQGGLAASARPEQRQDLAFA